jgi:hypothetical protein
MEYKQTLLLLLKMRLSEDEAIGYWRHASSSDKPHL